MRQRKRHHNQKWRYLLVHDFWRGMDGWGFEDEWLSKTYTDVDELMRDLLE